MRKLDRIFNGKPNVRNLSLYIVLAACISSPASAQESCDFWSGECEIGELNVVVEPPVQIKPTETCDFWSGDCTEETAAAQNPQTPQTPQTPQNDFWSSTHTQEIERRHQAEQARIQAEQALVEQQRREQLAESKRQEELRTQQARLRQQQEAQSKKKRSGFWGGLAGVTIGAVIGSEMGLAPEQVGEFAQTFGKLGVAVEKGDAASLQEVRRDVDGLEARLEAAAPPKPSFPSNAAAPINNSDDQFSRENIDASLAERNRIVAERNDANQKALSGISSAAQAKTNTAQIQSERMANSDFKEYNLIGTIPTLSDCVTITSSKDPTYIRNSCGTETNQAKDSNGNQNNSPNNSSNGLSYPGPDSFTIDNGTSESSSEPSGFDNVPAGSLKTVVRGSQPPLTRGEYNDLQERYGCSRPEAGCLQLVKSRYANSSGQMDWKIENTCSGTVAYRYSLPSGEYPSEGSNRTSGRDIHIYSWPKRELSWRDEYLSVYGVGNSNVSRQCYNNIFKTRVTISTRLEHEVID